MTKIEILRAYENKQPVTFASNVQALRKALHPNATSSFNIDPSGQVGKKLRIEFAELSGTMPFVRITGFGNVRPKIKTPSGDFVDLGELMIPIEAVKIFKLVKNAAVTIEKTGRVRVAGILMGHVKHLKHGGAFQYWQFRPAIAGRQVSRKTHHSPEACIPAWVKKFARDKAKSGE